MAPEVENGDRYDQNVDVYSIGAILYELIFGEVPHFPGAVSVTVSTQGNISEELRSLVEHMIARNLRDRLNYDKFSMAVENYKNKFNSSKKTRIFPIGNKPNSNEIAFQKNQPAGNSNHPVTAPNIMQHKSSNSLQNIPQTTDTTKNEPQQTHHNIPSYTSSPVLSVISGSISKWHIH